MTKVIHATRDGAGLFNALAIGLGIEILSGRLDAQKDTPGYQRLLDEFALHHPGFMPKNWKNLKHWLAFYNDSRDMELILAPVLFRMSQHDTDYLDEQILQELTYLVWNNKTQIEFGTTSRQLTMTDELPLNLFPKINNLALKEKQGLLGQLKRILKNYTGELNLLNVKEFLAQNAIELLTSLKMKISANPAVFQRGYGWDELNRMMTPLNISLVINGVKSPSDDRIKISLKNILEHWDVYCEDVDVCFVNQSDPKLRMTSSRAFQGKMIVAAPTQEEIESLAKPGVLIRDQIIDNPARGNCCFYAFAIGLIHIIQEESSYKNKEMFKRWLALDRSLQDQYDAICAFKFDRPNIALLNHLQSSLRLITHHGQLAELKKACANPANDYQELVGNGTYIKFAEFYYNRAVDRRFNEFAASPEIGTALRALNLEVIPNFEHLTLVPLFLSLIYGTDVNPKLLTIETNPSDQSPVVSAMANITQDFFWGTHHDLNYLANIFKVNFHPLQNRVARFPFVDLHDRQTITINNRNNIHWTTQITLAKETSGFSFTESGDSLGNKPLLSYEPLAESDKKKRKTTERVKEEGVISALKSHSSVTPSMNKPSSEGSDVGAKSEAGVELLDPLNVEPHKRAVRFHFSPSQLKDQRKHNLELLDHELGQFSKKAAKSVEDIEQLEFLRGAVSRATIAYTEYSEGIWFSLFHRHGNTGRVRARTFHERFLDIENSTDAKRNLIRFLSNNSNGNTHPHSFRTMLLQELQASPKTLQYTSEHFNDLLEELASVLSVNIDTVRPKQ